MINNLYRPPLAKSRVCATILSLTALLASTALALPPNNSFSVLYNFQGGPQGDGETPLAGLTLVGSTLFGTTFGGGGGNSGTVFRINTDGTNYGRMYEFTGPDGRQPSAGLRSAGTTLYGTTEIGGTFNRGTIFKIDGEGTGFNVLHNLTLAEGWDPKARVTLVGNALYGTAITGGNFGGGTIFSLNPDGTNFTVRHHLQSQVEATSPWAGLVSDGAKLYGAAQFGGAPFGANGAVFRANLDGSSFTQLHTFAGEGVAPLSTPILAGTTLYGTTLGGGAFDRGTIYRVNTDGTGFQTLYSFTPDDGWFPKAGVTLVGPILYGTTQFSGTFDSVGGGIAYRINTDGRGFHVIHRFAGGADDGLQPYGELVFDGSKFFGTTSLGGNAGAGTVFTIAVPEPSTAMLLIPALIAFRLRRRRCESRS